MFVFNRTVWCLLVLTNCVLGDIDTEYFFGGFLRDAPGELNCDNEALRLYCETRCGETHACLFGKCFCIRTKQEYDQRDYLKNLSDDQDKFLDFDDYMEMTQMMPAGTFPEHPALRHHIAHFCPNLEEARKCIRTCMKQGKPAFCGKDHVCYCGHKYETPEGEEPVNVQELYSQFRDLYQKYFGEPDFDHSHEDYH